jgi:hypothetical protein
LGWARANILYEKATRLPEPGSPMEIIFLLVWNMRQKIEFQKARAELQALLSQKGAEPKEILQAFDDLRESFFPFDKNAREADLKEMRETLMREVSRGLLSLVPQVDLNRHKIASKLARGQKLLDERIAMQQRGRMESIDAFDRARRKPRRTPAPPPMVFPT